MSVETQEEWGREVAAEVAAAPDADAQIGVLRAAATGQDPERLHRIVVAGKVLAALPGDARARPEVVRAYVAAELAGAVPDLFLFAAAEQGGEIDAAGSPRLAPEGAQREYDARKLHIETRTWVWCSLGSPDGGRWELPDGPPTELTWVETASGRRRVARRNAKGHVSKLWPATYLALSREVDACGDPWLASWIDASPTLVTGNGHVLTDPASAVEVAGISPRASGPVVDALLIVRRNNEVQLLWVPFTLPLRIGDAGTPEDLQTDVDAWNAELHRMLFGTGDG